MADLHYLSPKDLAFLKAWRKQDKERRINDDTPFRGDATLPGPDTYFARVPCGSIIPKRVGMEPGHEKCCLFHLEWKTNIHNPDEYVILPILHPDGTQVRVEVYNYYELDIRDHEFNLITKTKDGRWVCEDPPNTSSPTTTSTTSGVNPCAGFCVFIWDPILQNWQLSEGHCAPTTTTTIAPTTTLFPTTTTTTDQNSTPPTMDPNKCLCPGEPVFPDCNCHWPQFCGNADNHIVTSCQPGITAGPPECRGPTLPPTTSTTLVPTTTTTPAGTTTTTTAPPTTTTLTCDCNTSTTANPTTTTPGPCSLGCDWRWVPIHGGTWGWIRTFNGCHSDCPCDPPPQGPGQNDCAIAHTDCAPLPPQPPPPPPGTCGGHCEWWWDPDLSRWHGLGNFCEVTSGFVVSCNCVPPSWNGSNDCAHAQTPCFSPTPTTTPGPTTTTTTPGVCSGCYPEPTLPPTTSTSTTCGPCQFPCEFCIYIYSGSCDEWQLDHDGCPSETCNCPEDNIIIVNPGVFNPADGSEYYAPCQGILPTTTTTVAPGTTTSTTTTMPPCQDFCKWIFSPDCSDWVNVDNPCDSGCPCEPPLVFFSTGHPGNPDGTYSLIAHIGLNIFTPCQNTTTTLNPATTSTTTCRPTTPSPTTTTAPPTTTPTTLMIMTTTTTTLCPTTPPP